MKKTVKRFLSAALALTMIIGVFAMQASAHPEDTKTFVLMDDDMDNIETKYFDHASTNGNLAWGGGSTTDEKLYNGGEVWANTWGIPSGTFSYDNGGMTISTVAGTNAGEQTMTKYAFKKYPAESKTDVRITYDIQTGSKVVNSTEEGATQTESAYNIVGLMSGQNLFRYDSNSLILYYGGTGEYDWPWDETKTQLAENSDYTLVFDLVYDEKNDCYDLTGTAKDSEGNTVRSATVDNWMPSALTDSANFTTIAIRMRYVNSMVVSIPVMTFKNIKIENIIKGDIVNFGDVEYDNDLVMIDCSSGADISNAVSIEDAKYLNGAEWGASNIENINSTFATDGTKIIAKTTKTGLDTLSKKFAPIRDGEMLNISADIRLQGYQDFATNAADLGQLASLRLLGTDVDRTLLNYVCRTSGQEYMHVLSKNLTTSIWDDYANTADTSVTTTGTGKYVSWDSVRTITKNDNIFKQEYNQVNSGKNWNMFDGTVKLEFTAVPNADGENYDITLDLTSTLLDTTSTVKVPKAEVLAMDTIAIHSRGQGTSVRESMAVSNLKIEKHPVVEKTALTVGQNTVYLPIENVTGHAVDFALIAAVCDKATDAHKAYFVETYDEHCKGADNLAIDVEITDPATEYVKLYVWDSFNNLVPYTEPISTK